MAIEIITDDVNAKFSRLLTIVIFLFAMVGFGSIGFNLITKYLQAQQISQVQKANDLLAQKKYSSAIAVYDRLLQSDSAQSQILWGNRGAALLGLNQYSSALQSCDKATSLDPKADLAWNCRGEALYYLGQYDAALTAFQQAIAINPQNATFWLNQNQVLLDLSQHQEAVLASKKAIALLQSPSQTSSNQRYLAIALRRQGNSWLKLQQNQQALAAFNKSLTYQPNYLSAQQGRGIALYRLGLYRKAIQAFDEILQRNNLTSEQQAINWLYKGISLCQTPQSAAATEAFEQVIKLTQNRQSQKIAQAGCGIR